MNLNEAVNLLGKWDRDTLITIIRDGIELPSTKQVVRLRATAMGSDFDITDDALDEYIDLWDQEEPGGRWPKVAIRRALLLEAGFKCVLCSVPAPLQFHHIIEYSQFRHYDTRYMIAICGTCHTRCGLGQIDRKTQQEAKRKARQLSAGPEYLTTVEAASRFSWDDLSEVLEALHATLQANPQTGESRFDFSDVDIEEKNRLNDLGEDYFAIMRDTDEPYFGRIQDFLKNPASSAAVKKYHEIVDELRRKIATDRARFESFESVLMRFGEVAVAGHPAIREKRKALRTLLSFMYFNCDIGKKTSAP